MGLYRWRRWLMQGAVAWGKRKPGTRRAPPRRPQLEALEDRLAPATLDWLGAESAGFVPWSLPIAWKDESTGLPATPQTGDQLVFPATAITKLSQDDITTAGFSIQSITFQGNGYSLNASAGNSLTVTGSITDQASGGSNGFGIPLTLPNTIPIGVTQSNEVLLLESPGPGLFQIGGAGGITKTGPGQLSVFSANNYTGPTQVSAGLVFVGTGGTLPGTLTVGTGSGPGAQVLLNADNATDPMMPVTVNSDGLLAVGEDGSDPALTSFAGSISRDTVGSVTLNGGTVSIAGPQSDIGTSVLTLGGDVTANASSSTATIQGGGTLQLGAPTVTFTVAAGADPALVVSAAVTDGEGPSALVKAGGGRMVLSAANAYSNGTDVTAGELNLQNSAALGTGPAAVETGAALELQPPSGQSLIFRNELTLSGSGVGGTGALRSIRGPNNEIAASGIVLAADSTIGVDVGSLGLNQGGPLTGPGGLTKAGAEILVLPGRNTYAGTTQVDEGFLVLAGPEAVPGSLTVGTGAGPGAEAQLLANAATDPTAAVTVNSDGRLNVRGFADTIGSLTGSGRVNLTAPPNGGGPGAAGTLTTGTNGSSTAFAGLINGAGGNLVKVGGGTFTLTGANTYSGATTINGGTLRVDGSQPASPVVVNAGGTLGGRGTVGPTAVNPGGVVAPGDSPGVLSVQGGIGFGPGSVLFAEINGPAAGSGYDQLRVAGTVSLNKPTLRLALGFAPAPGQDFVLIANDGAGTIGGTFAGAPEDALVAHGATFFDISYAGGRGRDVDLLSQSRGDLFVRGLFADFNAPSTRGTRAPFEAQVDGGQGRLAAAQSFLMSPPRLLGEVNLFYTVFGQPDDGLKGGYLKQLLSGVPSGQVLLNFLTSRSFRRLHRSNRAFVKALFTGLLGHAPGKHDLLGHHTMAFYLAELNAGTVSRANLVRRLLSSDEVYAAAVTQNFETLLGTVPTPAQLQALSGEFAAGTLAPDALSELLVTQEAYVDFFIARVAAGLVPGVVLASV